MHFKSVYRGRIIEIWSSGTDTFFEFMEEDRRSLFKTSKIDSFQAIQRGDLVKLEISHTDSADVKEIISLEKLSGPYRKWSPAADSMRWRKNLSGPSRMSLLWQRQKILSVIRQDLIEEGFLEAETPLLVKGTCPDTEIESVVADEGYLVTSTEYQIKRMIVGGFEKVFTLTKNFRRGDRGRFHSSEFTMLEWARAFESLDMIEEDAVRFIRKAFQLIYPGKTTLLCNGDTVEILNQPWERLTVREALKRYLGMEELGDFSLNYLLKSAENAGVDFPANFRENQHLILSYLLDSIQPNLGKYVPTFLREWPAFMTSSAKINDHDRSTAVRSELFIAGIEIADGFPFLMNPSSQMEFFNRELDRRRREGKKHLTIDDHYISALAEGIPPGAGMALGIDRLVMALTGAQTLSDVQPFSWNEL